MDKPTLVRIAKATATAHVIIPEMFCALIEHESSWDTWAIRYEAAFYLKYVAPLQGLTATEKTSRSFSYGLCQIMGQTAREFGFTQRFLTELCDPVVGLEYGARKLKACLDDMKDNPVNALLRYNGGGDLSYPDAVLKLAQAYR